MSAYLHLRDRDVQLRSYRPAHAVILGVFYLVKYAVSADHGGKGDAGAADGSGGGGGGGADDHGSGAAAAPGGHGAEDGHHGYQIFHVEFERVQLPFIISLWIFVSSLAKIGRKEMTLLHLQIEYIIGKPQ
jgi:hypothetical protein